MIELIFKSALFVFIAHTYLYWQHRALHYFFPTMHGLHHKWKYKTVFHLGEQILNWAIFPIGWLIGFTTNEMLLVLIWSIIFVFTSHREKKSKKKSWIFMTSLAHEAHHDTYNKNYGVLLTLWDRLMGTYA